MPTLTHGIEDKVLDQLSQEQLERIIKFFRKNISLPELNGFDVEEVKDCMYGLFDSDQFPEDLRDLINYNEGGFHPLEYLLMHPEFAEAFPIYNGRRIIS